MFADTRPAALDAHGAADAWADFRVQHPQERKALLRQLRDTGVPVMLSGPGGASVTCTLWSLDDDGLAFSADPQAPQLLRLLEANEAVAEAYLDSVKLQFDVLEAMLVHGREASTLRCAVPQEIYRFQRRQAYRVRALEHHAPVARLRHPALPEMQFALRVLDVSIGGCALWQPEDVPALAAGTEIADVEVTLDGDTRFHALLRLQHVSATSPGGHGARLGCEWQLGPSAERSLQRWIDQAQKRRRLMHLG